MTKILEADSIQLAFGSRSILSDIYIRCDKGKITGLLGRNGQGKTSLMRVIYGELEASGSSVRFDNRPVPQSFKRPDLIAYLPQFNFIPGSLPLYRIMGDFNIEFSDLEKELPELSSRYKSRIRDLSGGQRRLLETYVILRSPSEFALLDEPFSHLMPVQV